MSSNKFQPGEEMFDEVTGHAIRGNVVTDEDAEGHVAKIKAVPADDDETEGHAIKYKAVPADDDQETAGHGLRGYLVGEDDETDGHSYRVKAAPTDDETEGHGRVR
jgi:hypothetical protein